LGSTGISRTSCGTGSNPDETSLTGTSPDDFFPELFFLLFFLSSSTGTVSFPDFPDADVVVVVEAEPPSFLPRFLVAVDDESAMEFPAPRPVPAAFNVKMN
jgi:hypothetical protein